MPLDDNYSFDAGINKAQIKRNDCAISCTPTENLLLEYLSQNPQATQVEAAHGIGKSRRAVQDAIATLKAKGLLTREGAKKNGHWVVIS